MTDGDTACETCASDGGKRVVQPKKKALANRVRRVEGQVSGIGMMIADDRYCVDILTQISAAKAALDGIAAEILTSHARGCVRRAVREDGGDEVIEELVEVIRRLVR